MPSAIPKINPIDVVALKADVRVSTPVPNFCIDNFLDPEFAADVLAAFPSYSEALKTGRSFDAVNEKGKVQQSDASTFPGPIAELNRVLASPGFLGLLTEVFDLPDLVPDESLTGGGIHQTGPRGHLDVHVDFNYVPEHKLHRRLNILIYFNPGWKPEYGGNLQLWDADVKLCRQSFSPIFNRAVVFETNNISYHGVTAVKCPEGMSRKSFAAYYYTKDAPDRAGQSPSTSTIFRPRPDEILKGSVMMPLEKASRMMGETLRVIKRKIIK